MAAAAPLPALSPPSVPLGLVQLFSISATSIQKMDLYNSYICMCTNFPPLILYGRQISQPHSATSLFVFLSPHETMKALRQICFHRLWITDSQLCFAGVCAYAHMHECENNCFCVRTHKCLRIRMRKCVWMCARCLRHAFAMWVTCSCVGALSSD